MVVNTLNPDLGIIVAQLCINDHFTFYTKRILWDFCFIRLWSARLDTCNFFNVTKRLLKSVQRLRFGSVCKKWDSKHPLPLDLCPATTPEPISSVIMSNVHCNVVCTCYPDFEIKSHKEAHTTRLLGNHLSIFMRKWGFWLK